MGIWTGSLSKAILLAEEAPEQDPQPLHSVCLWLDLWEWWMAVPQKFKVTVCIQLVFTVENLWYPGNLDFRVAPGACLLRRRVNHVVLEASFQ